MSRLKILLVVGIAAMLRAVFLSEVKCEGYKALVLPMAGDHTIFTDLPKPKDFCESFEFEGVREKANVK